MIVVDASVILEILLQTKGSARVMKRIFRGTASFHAPHLLDLEVAQVIRRYVRNGSIEADRGEEALTDFLDLPIERYPHEPLLRRIWKLGENLTAYDAAYVALAEALRAPLLTVDERLANASGHDAVVELV